MLADDLHLRGRGEHVERAFAHHRIEEFPALVRRKLEQRFIDRGKGDVGARRGFAVRGAHLDRDLALSRIAYFALSALTLTSS